MNLNAKIIEKWKNHSGFINEANERADIPEKFKLKNVITV